ncbi:MAG: terminase, partial [Segatella copri]
LEAIHWYVTERSGRNDFSVMASEYPSDDIEAFVHSGHMVFDKYQIDDMKKKCFPAKYIGEVVGDSEDGEDALKNLRFVSDHQGLLQIWSKPEEFTEYDVAERYLTVVDIGGRSNKSDFSVITVFDLR